MSLCAVLASSACAAPVPRLLHVPPPAPPGAACARGAFELALGADGRVRRDGLRWLAWDGEAAALGDLLHRAAASRWEVPSAGDRELHALLHLDCTGSDGAGEAWRDLRARAQESLRARRRATAELRRLHGGGWDEHDLDCLWGTLDALRRGPFLYDDLRLASAGAARVAAATTADGGVWVCRAARSTHTGQLVILDRSLRPLAVAPYVLGE